MGPLWGPLDVAGPGATALPAPPLDGPGLHNATRFSKIHDCIFFFLKISVDAYTALCLSRVKYFFQPSMRVNCSA